MIVPLCAWACLFLAYLVLAGQTSADEMVAGALCAVAAVLWWVGTRRVSPHGFKFDSGSWMAVGRACRKLPRATISVGAALLRVWVRPESGTVAHGFYAPGRRSNPDDAGRRAMGVLAASLAPDSFVLRTPSERDEIVMHALPAGAPPSDPRWPI